MSRPVHVTVVSTSLNPHSRSYALGALARRALQARGVPSTFHDLRETRLPSCGPPESYDDPNARGIRERVARSSHLLIAAPVYNYQLSSSAKNLVELVGREGLTGKTVGLLCSAGGRGSYMAPMTFANSLMLDFRCWIVPRFVYAVPEDFDDHGELANPEIGKRIGAMIDEMLARG